MKVIDPGHVYHLTWLDEPDDDMRGGLLTFVKREGEGYPGNVGHHAGTTSQEVLRALIERSEYVNNQIPCAETEAAGELMKAALLLLELRAARRHGRWIEVALEEVVNGAVCEKCGHSGCGGDCR